MTYKALHIPTRCHSYHIRHHHPCHGHESTHSEQKHRVHRWNTTNGHIHGWYRLCTKFNTRLARSPFRALRCLQTCRLYRSEGWVSPWDHACTYPTHSPVPAYGAEVMHIEPPAQFFGQKVTNIYRIRRIQLNIN